MTSPNYCPFENCSDPDATRSVYGWTSALNYRVRWEILDEHTGQPTGEILTYYVATLKLAYDYIAHLHDTLIAYGGTEIVLKGYVHRWDGRPRYTAEFTVLGALKNALPRQQ